MPDAPGKYITSVLAGEPGDVCPTDTWPPHREETVKPAGCLEHPEPISKLATVFCRICGENPCDHGVISFRWIRNPEDSISIRPWSSLGG